LHCLGLLCRSITHYLTSVSVNYSFDGPFYEGYLLGRGVWTYGFRPAMGVLQVRIKLWVEHADRPIGFHVVSK